MKTIKITEYLHNEIRKVQMHLNLKTIGQTLAFLLTFYKERMKEYDKSKK